MWGSSEGSDEMTTEQGQGDTQRAKDKAAEGSSSELVSSGDDEISEESDSNEDDESDAVVTWLNSMHAIPSGPQTITLDSDDENDDENGKGEMKCRRCPKSLSVFKNRALFALHRHRHMGKCHFVCPTCLKPFVNINFCFAHEVRVHDTNFGFTNKFISAALEYRAKKRKENKTQENETICSGSSSTNKENDEPGTSAPETEKEFYGRNLFPEEGEVETDEDDAKFYPGHAVPSTALYPYRGPEPQSNSECYEIQLKFGRKGPSGANANTVSRHVLEQRQKLLKDGTIPTGTVGRFWKGNPSARRGRKRKATAASTPTPRRCR